MSRTVSLTMNQIFETLKKHVAENDVGRIKKVTRRIKADVDEPKVIDFVAHCKISHICYRRFVLMGFLYRDTTYILVPQISSNFLEDLGLSLMSESAIIQGAGMLAIANDFLPLSKGVQSLNIIENCLGNDSSDIIEFLFSQISELFVQYSIFKIDENRFPLQYKEDYDRLYALSIPSDDYISVSVKDCLNKLLLLQGSRSIAASIYNSIESPQLEYSYLQLYQCMEYLFVVKSGLSLATQFSISTENAIDIASSGKLKSTELDNLITVLKCTPEYVIDVFYNSIRTNSLDDNTDKINAVASYIYKIRCSVAHLRFNQPQLLATVHWDTLIENLALIIQTTYQKLDTEIIEICSLKESWEKITWQY